MMVGLGRGGVEGGRGWGGAGDGKGWPRIGGPCAPLHPMEHELKPLSFDLRSRVLAAIDGGSFLPAGGGALWRERVQCDPLAGVAPVWRRRPAQAAGRPHGFKASAAMELWLAIESPRSRTIIHPPLNEPPTRAIG